MKGQAIKMTEKKSKQKNLSEEEKILHEKRVERFTWSAGDVQFFSNKEEFEEQMKKEGRKVVWY